MTVTDDDGPASEPAPDPGNAPPDRWAVPLSDDETAEVMAEVDDPADPVVVAALAGTLYDPDDDDGDQEASDAPTA